MVIKRRPMDPRDNQIDRMFEEVGFNGVNLTVWEEGYIEDIRGQWARKRWLSDAQFEILERIYSERTP